jgi:nicotinamidase-related amidase
MSTPTTSPTTSPTTALVVIDVQNANTAEGWQRDEVIGRIRGLIDRARSAGAPVIWVQHSQPGSALERGSDGWQIVEAVRPGDDDTVIEKHYLDSFVETSLREKLDELGVGHLVLCGAATDACIRATSARSQMEGYDTTLVADGHTTDIGPWELPLPDGRKIPVGAEQMIAYTNFFVADTEYPGVTTQVVPADEVEFVV